MGVRLDLIVSSPGRPAQRLRVRPASAGGWVVIGSAPGCDVRVHDPRAAARACRVGSQGLGLVLEALEGGGALVNGAALGAPHRLAAADRLQVGQSTVVFERIGEDEEAEAATPTPPAARGPAPVARVPATAVVRAPAPAGGSGARTAVTIASAEPPADRAAAGVGGPGGVGGAESGGSRRDGGRGFVEGLVSRLRGEYNPRCFQGAGESDLRRTLERGVARAAAYGLEGEAAVEAFLRCIVLTGDELKGPETPAGDVYFALTNPAWTVEERARRAVRQALRYAKNTLGFDPLSREPVAPHAASPGRAPSPAREPPPARSPARPSPARPAPVDATSDDAPTRHATEQNLTEGDFPPAPPPLAPGESEGEEPPPEIEGYEYLAPLGGGGMGRVFKYRDRALDCEVAIKVVRSHFHDAHRQIRVEAQNAAKLRHPNVVPVMGFREDARRGYYIMQFVRGKDAHRLVQECAARVGGREPLDDVLGIAGVDAQAAVPDVRAAAGRSPAYYSVVAAWIAGAADGLGAAHLAQVVHRDVKPSNLIVGVDGRMMILDFGLATTAYDSSTGGARVGTPRYLAPETVAEWAAGVAQPPEPGVDVWGLGATLYELLALAPAYPSRGSEALVLRDIVTRDPTPPRQVRWDVPERLEEICLRALRRNPDDRYRSMSELASDLREWLDQAGRGPRRGEGRPGKRLWR